VIPAQAVERLVSKRVTFEKERGVTEVTTNGIIAHLRVPLRSQSPRVPQELEIDRLLAENELSIYLLKLHDDWLSCIRDEPPVERAARLLEQARRPAVERVRSTRAEGGRLCKPPAVCVLQEAAPL
jgi:hypothetical protein